MSVYDIRVESDLSHPGPTDHIHQVMKDLDLLDSWSLETITFRGKITTVLIPSNEYIVAPSFNSEEVAYRATLSGPQIRQNQEEIERALGVRLKGSWSIHPYV